MSLSRIVVQDLSNAVLLVFANKQDCVRAATAASSGDAASSSSSSSSLAPSSSCMTPAQIAELLNLQAIKTHPWHIQSCCAITGEGLYEV